MYVLIEKKCCLGKVSVIFSHENNQRELFIGKRKPHRGKLVGH